MTQSVTLINITTDTFQTLINKVNELANLTSNTIVTANSDANGSITTGNAYGNGIFSYTTLTAVNGLRGGNVQSSAELPITSNVAVTGVRVGIGNSTVNSVVNSTSLTFSNSTVSFTFTKPTAAQKADDAYFLNANGSWLLATGRQPIEHTTTGTSAQEVDSWLLSAYFSMEYTSTINDNAANNRTISKLVVVQDEGNAYFTEYAVTDSNTSMGPLTANANSTHVRVWFTPTSANTTIRLLSNGTRK